MEPQTLTVRIPCSTSNLGPGFDCLGLALSLFLEVRLTTGGPGGLEVSGGPAGADPDSDLVARALAAGLALAGRDARGLRVHQHSEIPTARGLGSSGAAAAAGLLLASRLVPGGLPSESLVRLGLELEGHPDNVIASLRGGLVHSVPGTGPGDGCRVLELPLAADLEFAVAWPEAPLPTERARAALPERVPLGDAVENARRLPLLLAGLGAGDRELIAAGSVDALHERHRLPLLPGAADALEAARASGAFAANISGSGSALVAIAPPSRSAAVAEAMGARLKETTGTAETRVLQPVFGAPVVEPG